MHFWYNDRNGRMSHEISSTWQYSCMTKFEGLSYHPEVFTPDYIILGVSLIDSQISHDNYSLECIDEIRWLKTLHALFHITVLRMSSRLKYQGLGGVYFGQKTVSSQFLLV